jgi:flavin-binding protein dodecin
VPDFAFLDLATHLGYLELAGSSEISHADAIENAIARASKTTRHLRWFEVTQMRGGLKP